MFARAGFRPARLESKLYVNSRFCMLTVGLTGSSGSGKGYVSSLLERAGIPCLDTDRVCREVYKKGNPCYQELVAAFGEGILGPDREIDRGALRKTAFAAEERYRKLNEIAFRHIRKATVAWLEEQRQKGEKVAVIDAPMLFESGFDSLCDKIVAVTADTETQIRRIVKRDGVGEEVAAERLKKQKPNAEYLARADFALDNSDAVGDQIKEDAAALAEKLKALAEAKGMPGERSQEGKPPLSPHGERKG